MTPWRKELEDGTKGPKWRPPQIKIVFKQRGGQGDDEGDGGAAAINRNVRKI